MISSLSEKTKKFYNWLNSFFKHRPKEILHIAGEDGTGRTTLILNYLLFALQNSEKKCYIIDGEHKFTKKSFQLFGDLAQNVYISKKSRIKSMNSILKQLMQSNLISERDILVINSLSEEIKQKLAFSENYADYISIVHDFINSTIPSLAYFLQKIPCKMIIRHQVSYDFDYDQTLPYFSRLMNLLPGAWIMLKKQPFQKQNLLIFSYSFQNNNKIKKIQSKYNFYLENGGFIINSEL
jgi:hypothetical protein